MLEQVAWSDSGGTSWRLCRSTPCTLGTVSCWSSLADQLWDAGAMVLISPVATKRWTALPTAPVRAPVKPVAPVGLGPLSHCRKTDMSPVGQQGNPVRSSSRRTSDRHAQSSPAPLALRVRASRTTAPMILQPSLREVKTLTRLASPKSSSACRSSGILDGGGCDLPRSGGCR